MENYLTKYYSTYVKSKENLAKFCVLLHEVLLNGELLHEVLLHALLLHKVLIHGVHRLHMVFTLQCILHVVTYVL